jgi:HSP20 family molecular chaperone IbpA
MNDMVALYDELFDIMMGRPSKGSLAFTKPYREYPYTDIYQDGDLLVIEVALAGWKKDDIDVELEGNVLTVSGKSETKKDEKKTYSLKGIKRSSFSTTFNLKTEWLGGTPDTTFEDGILKVVFKKDETKKIKLLK